MHDHLYQVSLSKRPVRPSTGRSFITHNYYVTPKLKPQAQATPAHHTSKHLPLHQRPPTHPPTSNPCNEMQCSAMPRHCKPSSWPWQRCRCRRNWNRRMPTADCASRYDYEYHIVVVCNNNITRCDYDVDATTTTSTIAAPTRTCTLSRSRLLRQRPERRANGRCTSYGR